MKIKIFILTISFFFLYSCKKCRVCECSKNGSKTIEKNCGYGSAGKKNLDTWEKYLKDEKGYDTVVCHDEK